MVFIDALEQISDIIWEIPISYIDDVIEATELAGLSKRVVRFTPIGDIKGGIVLRLEQLPLNHYTLNRHYQIEVA